MQRLVREATLLTVKRFNDQTIYPLNSLSNFCQSQSLSDARRHSNYYGSD